MPFMTWLAYMGENSIHLDLHATGDGGITVADADKLSEKIFEKIKRVHPEVKHISVHFCPHDGVRRKIYENDKTHSQS